MDDPAEREADAVADTIVDRAAPSHPDGLAAPRTDHAIAAHSLLGDFRSSTGSPLDPQLRATMESAFRADFGQVRIHTGPTAAASARSIGARAYTAGSDVVFGSGRFDPDSRDGRRTLAHELTHVVQQTANRGASTARNVVQRQCEPEDGPGGTDPLPLGVTVIPGPTRTTDLLGARVPVPGSIRLTNALGAVRGPSAVVDLSPNLFVGHLLENIDLYTWTRSGTPPEALPSDENQARISLINPTLTLDPSTRRLRGWATLRVASDYPESLIDPTDIRADIESTELGQFSGRLGYGPLHADFRLRLHYDVGRIETAIGAGLRDGSLRKTRCGVERELRHPGFTLRGGLGLGRLPLSRYAATASTTVEQKHSLLGAPTKFPLDMWAAGVIIAPPGAVAAMSVPALGFSGSWFGSTRGSSLTAAALPKVDPDAISAGRPAATWFPVYGYIEYSHVRRVSSDLDLGLRLTLQVSTLDFLPREGVPLDPTERIQSAVEAYQTSQRGETTSPPPNVGIAVFGRFNGP